MTDGGSSQQVSLSPGPIPARPGWALVLTAVLAAFLAADDYWSRGGWIAWVSMAAYPAATVAVAVVMRRPQWRAIASARFGVCVAEFGALFWELAISNPKDPLVRCACIALVSGIIMGAFLGSLTAPEDSRVKRLFRRRSA